MTLYIKTKTSQSLHQFPQTARSGETFRNEISPSPAWSARRSLSESDRDLRHNVYSFFIREMEQVTVSYERTGESFTDRIPENLEALTGVSASLFDYIEPVITRDSPAALYDHLKAQGRERLIVDNRIVAIPDRYRNVDICADLGKRFSNAQLLTVPGFTWEGCICLDLNERLSAKGFIVPVFEAKRITALRVYRHQDDERPFILRTREVALNA